MKLLNFYNPRFNGQDSEAYSILCTGITYGFPYADVAEQLKGYGVYIPEDQFNAFKTVLDIQLALDTGDRQNELLEGYQS